MVLANTFLVLTENEYGYEYEYVRTKTLKFLKVVYTPRMSPFGLTICGDVFQTILQRYESRDLFGRGGIFRETSQISEGRLPPQDVSVWLENL